MSGFRYESNWDAVAARIKDNVSYGVREATLDVLKQTVANITTAGLVDTDKYRGSWMYDLLPEGRTGTIGSPVEYGPYLEYGHYTRPAKANNGKPRSFVLARPHVRPAGDTIQRRIVEYFKRLDR